MDETGEDVNPTLEPAALVEAARAGDLAAFGALVRRYAPLAAAVALARTGRAPIADEVAQEALIDAWRLLPTLREPAAFAGWLRTIVVKHADRHTRRPRRDVVGLDDVAVAADDDPEQAVAIRETRRRVRAAVAALPPHLRETVALFHLSGATHAEVGALLGVPVSTVKKRLHDARRRLSLEVCMSVPSDLPAAVEAFVAVRAGRVELLAHALARRPGLVSRAHHPDPDEVAARYAPAGPGRTLLHEAAAAGRVEVARLLLDRGADPDARTAAGVTPLLDALTSGHVDLVRLLLARGADPKVRLPCGGTALHVARHRGLDDAAAALITAGADPVDVDPNGRTADDWARYPGATRPGRGGRTIDPSGRALDGGEVVAIPARRPAPVGPVEVRPTGIKAIDLLAPFARRGVHRLVGGAGVGKIVLVGELARCIGPVVVAGLLDRTWDVGDFEPMLRDLGAWDDAVVVLGSGDEDHPALVRSALALAEARGGWVVADDRLERELLAASPGVGALTFGPHRHPDVIPERGGLVAQIVLDPARAARGDFPAVDPAHSSSAAASGRHTAVADAVRAAIAEGGPRAERLLAWLTQPFRVAEEWNGRPGAVVDLAATLAEAEALLAGAHADRDPADLRYLQ